MAKYIKVELEAQDNEELANYLQEITDKVREGETKGYGFEVEEK